MCMRKCILMDGGECQVLFSWNGIWLSCCFYGTILNGHGVMRSGEHEWLMIYGPFGVRHTDSIELESVDNRGFDFEEEIRPILCKPARIWRWYVRWRSGRQLLIWPIIAQYFGNNPWQVLSEPKILCILCTQCLRRVGQEPNLVAIIFEGEVVSVEPWPVIWGAKNKCFGISQLYEDSWKGPSNQIEWGKIYTTMTQRMILSILPCTRSCILMGVGECHAPFSWDNTWLSRCFYVAIPTRHGVMLQWEVWRIQLSWARKVCRWSYNFKEWIKLSQHKLVEIWNWSPDQP